MGGTMRLGADPIKLHDGHAGARDLRRGGHLRAPPPPLRGQQPAAQAPRGRRACVLLGHLARRAPRRGDRARRTHPFFVASQFHPEFKSRPERPAPLFRDFVRRARSARRALRGAEARRGEPAVVTRRRAVRRRGAPSESGSTTRSPSCAGSRARPAASAPAPSGERASCARSGWRSRRTAPEPRWARTAATCSRASPAPGSGGHPACAPPRHCPADRARRAGARRRGVENANEASSAPTTRPPSRYARARAPNARR